MATLLKRIGDWWERTPPAFTGPVLANRLGWQMLRVFWFNLTRNIGFYRLPTEVKSYADILRRDGVVLIPDFLSEDVAREIRAEYEKDNKVVPEKPLAAKYVIPASGKTKVVVQHFFPAEGTRLRTLLDTHIISNPFLKKLGSSIVHHEIQEYRAPQVFTNRKLGDEHPDLNSDIFYHADVSYPGVKAFYYLSDTDDTNGAFTYAKGTHKLSLRRLWWDYRKSIEHAQNRARVADSKIVGDETGRAWHCLTREEEKQEGIQGTPMVGKANSLLVFNVMGFHRRGDLTSDRPRAFALAYYRD